MAIEVLEGTDTMVALKRVDLTYRTAEIALLTESGGWDWDPMFEGTITGLQGPSSAPYGDSCACVVAANWDPDETQGTLYLAVGR